MGFLGRLGRGLGFVGAIVPGVGTALAGVGGALAAIDPEDPEALIVHPYKGDGTEGWRSVFKRDALLYGIPTDLAQPFERREWIFGPWSGPDYDQWLYHHAHGWTFQWGRDELARTGRPELVLGHTSFREGGNVNDYYFKKQGYRARLKRNHWVWPGKEPNRKIIKAERAIGIFQSWQERLQVSKEPGFVPEFYWIDNRPLDRRLPEIALRALDAPGSIATNGPGYHLGDWDTHVISRWHWDECLELAASSTEEPWQSARQAELEEVERAQAEWDLEAERWELHRDQLQTQAAAAAAAKTFEDAFSVGAAALRAGTITEDGFWGWLSSVVDVPGADPSPTSAPLVAPGSHLPAAADAAADSRRPTTMLVLAAAAALLALAS